MKPSDFFALSGTVYLAPQASEFLGLAVGFCFYLAAVVLIFIERDDL